MTQARDIVQALIERAPPRAPIERSTGMPYGWALWLRALPPSSARAHASPAEVVELLSRQPPPPVPRGEELAVWPAFFSLFRPGWLPAPRDERPWRSIARVGSLVLHLFFVAFLAWVAWMQSLYMPMPTQAAGGGERVAVGFVGAGDPGTPQDAGTAPGAAAAAEPAAMAEQAIESGAPPSVPVHGDLAPAQLPAPPLPEVAVRNVPEPVQGQSAAAQPVQVTEVERPTIDYVLPPTTPRTIELRASAQPQLREREVAVVQAPALQMAQPRPQDVQVRQPREVEMEVRPREIDEPLPDVRVQAVGVRAPQVEIRLADAGQASVRQRDVAMPAEPAATAAPSTAAAAPSAQAAATGSAQADADGQARAPGQAATLGHASASTAPQAAVGSGTPSTVAGDDWGQAHSGTQRPGGAAGLFDGQGRVLLPGAGTGQVSGPGPASAAPGAGSADRGAPGGDSDHWSRERFEQSGTWLKRPPYDFEPTSFDRYWAPNESLLAEWVRKGMKTVAIPIPGTSKKINCVVSLLQLGGGCGIVDPNLNEQPTEGRPSPDIPFKPELQEDNGSVRP